MVGTPEYDAEPEGDAETDALIEALGDKLLEPEPVFEADTERVCVPEVLGDLLAEIDLVCVPEVLGDLVPEIDFEGEPVVLGLAVPDAEPL
jgi:hypothetical protein